MSGMDVLRGRIARSLWAKDGQLPQWDKVPPSEGYRLHYYLETADAVIADLGLVDEVSLGLGWRGDGIPRRRFLTEWKPIIEEGQCGADITHRDEHHRQSVCVRASGHSGAHDDGQGCVWTGATSERG